MIIVSLFEGLGNQMFQYAMARRLAEKHSTVLKLDVSSFESNKQRQYGLHCFNIQEHIATQDEIDALLKRPRNKFERFNNKLLNKIGKVSRPSQNFFLEKYFHFNPCVLEAPNNTYLHGFWQSEKYFIDIQDILINEFSFKYPQDDTNRDLNEKIKFHESTAIHIRRGDYINNDETNQLHEVCSLDYYNKSITYIAERVSNPHFFIFSNDLQWVKEKFQINFPITIIEYNNGFRSYEDLRLMSQCKHNIIANSSFSWWGAWLNQNPDKIVCVPQQWFRKKYQDTKYSLPKDCIPWYKDDFLDTKDLIPKNWIQL